jgi:hypothetical protein
LLRFAILITACELANNLREKFDWSWGMRNEQGQLPNKPIDDPKDADPTKTPGSEPPEPEPTPPPTDGPPPETPPKAVPPEAPGLLPVIIFFKTPLICTFIGLDSSCHAPANGTT